MKRVDPLILSLIGYLIVGIITFGHAAAAAERQEIAEQQICQRTDKVCLKGLPGANGFAAATLWPFYWSWEAFR